MMTLGEYAELKKCMEKKYVRLGERMWDADEYVVVEDWYFDVKRKTWMWIRAAIGDSVELEITGQAEPVIKCLPW